jgi:hypothetical protein
MLDSFQKLPSILQIHFNYLNSISLICMNHRQNKLLEYVIFSHYFYGICAVALSIEATLQQRYPLNSFLYFILVFITTVVYYNYPYIRKSIPVSKSHRTNWYSRHYSLMRWTQILFTAILMVSLILFLIAYGDHLEKMPAEQWFMIFIFPLAACLYYGFQIFSRKYNLRKIGWLKPFIIGFSWAGLVTIYPVLFYDILHKQEYIPNQTGEFLFIKNFMFITVLCIMFDIKDYKADYISHVKTFVVNVGLRKTIFYILLPLTLLGIGSFIYYAVMHQFHPIKIFLNLVPFILLILAAYSLRKRRSIMYYMVFIDGLMLVKAVCGIIAMLYF